MARPQSHGPGRGQGGVYLSHRHRERNGYILLLPSLKNQRSIMAKGTDGGEVGRTKLLTVEEVKIKDQEMDPDPHSV